MAIKYNNEYETERRENTQKSVDKLYDTMYNDGRNTNKYDVSDYVKMNEPDTTKRFGFAPEINGWARKNSDAIKYAGDGAIDSIKKAAKDYINKYLKDAPEETDKDELLSSIVKWQLARDANDEERGKVAMNNIIGHMSRVNKEHYLKEEIPLSEYVNAKDDFDHKTGKYSTTENASKAADEAVKKIQQKLNEKGYTNKYGNKLEEDGLVGSSTLQAYDSLEKDNKNDATMQNLLDMATPKYVWKETEDGNFKLYNESMDMYESFASVGGFILPPIHREVMSEVISKTGTKLSDSGKLSPGDESKNELKQTMIKCLSANWYSNDGNVEKQEKFKKQAEKLRDFDDNSFDRVIYLNNSSGAKGAGHNAIMLMNESGASVVFSFYSQSPKFLDSLLNGAEMRFSVLTPNQTNEVLYGEGHVYSMAASTGDIEYENYDGFLYYEIDNSQGYNMYQEAVNLYDDPGYYSLLIRQCDDIAARILEKGGVDIKKLLIPNGTFKFNDIKNRIERAYT